MNENTLFSVVIATHNRDHLLRRALDSVIAQTLPPLDIIVVDDVPSPSTESLVAEYARNSCKDIRYVKNLCPKRGWISSRNLGADQTKGDYIASLDDDDFWAKDYLQRVHERIAQYRVEMVLTVCTIVGPHKGKVRGKVPPEKYSQEECYLYNPGYLPSGYVIKKDKFLEVGGFDLKMGGSADKDLIMRLFKIGCRHKVINEELVYWWTGNGHTQGSTEAFLLAQYNIGFYRKYFKEMSLLYHWRILKKIARLYLLGLKKRLKKT